MQSKLNKRHISFIDEYMINGMNATDAYKKVYPKSSDESARRLGSKLLTKIDIVSEIKDRQNITSIKLGITKEELIQDLIDIKNNNKNVSPAVAIKAMEVLNKMSGFDAPEKIDHTTNGNDINPTTINVNIRKK